LSDGFVEKLSDENMFLPLLAKNEIVSLSQLRQNYVRSSESGVPSGTRRHKMISDGGVTA
jgi:hypothetical protein